MARIIALDRDELEYQFDNLTAMEFSTYMSNLLVSNYEVMCPCKNNLADRIVNDGVNKPMCGDCEKEQQGMEAENVTTAVVNDYRVTWENGETLDITGETFEEAFKNAGFAKSAMRAVDHWEQF